MRRVVITGLGLVTPLACGVEETWSRLLAGQSGAGPITRFDASALPCRVACEVPLGDGSDGTFNPDDWMSPKEARKVDTFILYAMAAAQQAVEDAGWTPEAEEDRLRTGVIIGSGIGGLQTIAETTLVLRDKGPRRVSPFFIPGSLINLCSGQVSIRYGFKGPNHSVVTACSTGAHAIGDAMRLILWKASAKRGRLLVRETAEPGEAGFSLRLDAAAFLLADDACFEKACAFAGSLAEDLFHKGRLTALAAGDEPFAPVKRACDLHAFLDRLSGLSRPAGVTRAGTLNPDTRHFVPGPGDVVHVRLRDQTLGEA